MALMPPVVLDGVDEVAQDVLFDIIGSCPEVEDMLRLMGDMTHGFIGSLSLGCSKSE
jgi:hypothetical protein